MPHLRFRAVEPTLVQQLSRSLIDELAPHMQSPRADFTFEYLYTTFYHEGEVSQAYPFVEVLWFDRGQTIKDAVAEIITRQVRAACGSDVNVAVIFSEIARGDYYDNGQHY